MNSFQVNNVLAAFPKNLFIFITKNQVGIDMKGFFLTSFRLNGMTYKQPSLVQTSKANNKTR